MSIHTTKYLRPNDWNEAVQALTGKEPGSAKPFIISPRPRALKDITAETLIDLSQLGLDYIQVDRQGIIHIGSLTPLETIVKSQPAKLHSKDLLPKAAYQAASLGIRNLASIWGTIADPTGPPEVILALLALNTQVTLTTSEQVQRTFDLVDLIASTVTPAQDEIIIEFLFRSLPNSGSGCAMERIARTPQDRAILAAVAVMETRASIIDRVSLALAGASQLPRRFPAAEQQLQNQPMTEQVLERTIKAILQEIQPVADYRGSSEYRREMASILARRALRAAWEQAIRV